jgi:hypothetical protein
MQVVVEVAAERLQRLEDLLLEQVVWLRGKAKM